MSHWVCVGPGAVASVVAARLMLRGESVFAASRNGCTEELRVSGHTQFTGNLEDITAHPCKRSHARWFIAVKAWQLAEVLKQFHAPLQQASAVIISHNGLGAAEAEFAALSPIPCYDYVTTHGSYTEGKEVIHSGLGQSWLGLRRGAGDGSTGSPDWYHTLAGSLPPLHWDTDIQARRWHKLAINCAINAIATLADAPNGVILQPQYREQVTGVCDEVAQVMTRALEQSIDSTTLLKNVIEVAEKTANNTNSMLQDVRMKRPTEIDFLNGYIEKKGRHYKIPTPFNSALCQAIRTLSMHR